MIQARDASLSRSVTLTIGRAWQKDLGFPYCFEDTEWFVRRSNAVENLLCLAFWPFVYGVEKFSILLVLKHQSITLLLDGDGDRRSFVRTSFHLGRASGTGRSLAITLESVLSIGGNLTGAECPKRTLAFLRRHPSQATATKFLLLLVL